MNFLAFLFVNHKQRWHFIFFKLDGGKKNPSNKQKEDYVVGNVWQHDLKRLAYDVLQEMFNNL